MIQYGADRLQERQEESIAELCRQADHEKAELAGYLHETTGLELGEEKTRIADLSEGFGFLGHRVRHHGDLAVHPRVGFRGSCTGSTSESRPLCQ